MNNKRRDKLKKALALLDTVCEMVEEVYDREQDCVDNYPENLQFSERYERMEEIVDELNDALGKLEEVKSCIESVTQR